METKWFYFFSALTVKHVALLSGKSSLLSDYLIDGYHSTSHGDSVKLLCKTNGMKDGVTSKDNDGDELKKTLVSVVCV